MAAETALSQYESALIRARTTGEIIRAAFDLQLAARGDEGLISGFPNPSAAEMGEWGASSLSKGLREKAKNALMGTPYEGVWRISGTPLSAPLPLFDNTASRDDELFINLRKKGVECRVTLRELHAPYAELAADWRVQKEAGKKPDPTPVSLACVIARGWLERPKPIQIEAERRKDKTVLGIVSGGETHPARQMGLDFGRRGSRTQSSSQLPVLADAGPHDVPILNMVDDAGIPVKAPNRGAPRALRFAVRTLAMVPTHARRPGQSIKMAITMRDIRDGLFQGRWRRWRDWPRTRDMLLEMQKYGITVGADEYFPWNVRYLPRVDNQNLDAEGLICIDLPPGTRNSGPIINLPVLDELGADSAGRYRAYVAAHTLSWRNGITRVPTPSGRWVWSGNEEHYPVLTKQDRRLLAFGPHDKKHRTNVEIDNAFQNLPGIVVLDEHAINPMTGKTGWRVAPTEAARAIARKRERTAKRGSRRGSAGSLAGEKKSLAGEFY